MTTTSSKSKTKKKAARTPIKISLWAPDPPMVLPMPLILKWAFPDGARRANVDNWRQLHLLWVPLEPTSWHPNVDHRCDSRSQEAHVARPSCNSVRSCKQLRIIRIVLIFRNGKRICHYEPILRTEIVDEGNGNWLIQSDLASGHRSRMQSLQIGLGNLFTHRDRNDVRDDPTKTYFT